MSEHHHPAPAQLIFHRGQRLVVSGHSQSLKLTGLYKSLPLTCQQQSRLNYKRTVVYSAHTKDIPQVPSLGDRGGCVTGPSRTPTTLGHTTKTQNQSSSASHIETNREVAKMRRQRNMVQMKEQIKIPEKELNKMQISNL